MTDVELYPNILEPFCTKMYCDAIWLTDQSRYSICLLYSQEFRTYSIFKLFLFLFFLFVYPTIETFFPFSLLVQFFCSCFLLFQDIQLNERGYPSLLLLPSFFCCRRNYSTLSDVDAIILPPRLPFRGRGGGLLSLSMCTLTRNRTVV